MHRPPFESVKLQWLTSSKNSGEGSQYWDLSKSGWVDYAMPAAMGKGKYEAFEMAVGMTLVRSRVDFSPNVLGKPVSMTEVDANYNEPSLRILALRGMHGSVKEAHTCTHLTASPGIDIFHFSKHFLASYFADGSFSGEVLSLSVGQTILNQLLGKEVVDALLDGLGISSPPGIASRPIPLHISQILFNAADTAPPGSLRVLFCQAKVLEYFASLCSHVCGDSDTAPEQTHKSRQRARAIHEQLVACEGKLPRLDELAGQYGRSAKLLNDEFAQEFGKTIHAFMADYRLVQAHTALEQSAVTIKQLANRLGYSHVNNFTIAFKKKFGYPPGSLRRK